ncbi:hypothetical protein WKW80_31805 [Variovorax humicola]|uniref:LysR substrate-binding domain-containing protein n=1 Tax=Variovorax humicola TaxID=1769758 RepID=A0ABU8W932_9BURK
MVDAAWLLDDSRVGISEAVRQWLLRDQIAMPRHVIECPYSMAAFILSTQTDAIAAVPKAALSLPWLAPLSQEIILDEPLPTVPIGIVMRRDSRLDAAATWLVERARLSLRNIATGGAT